MKYRLVQFVAVPTLILALIVQLSSCGTLLHPERRGQTGGKIDPSIAILDGIGLLFFIVPGLIAYAVDFSTGAIYLPGTASESGDDDSTDLLVIQSSPGNLSESELEAVLEQHTGQKIDLGDASVRSIPLEDAKEISQEYDKLVAAGVIPSR